MLERARASGDYFARTVWREGKGALRIVRTHLHNRLHYGAVANPYAVLWIDPRGISKKLAQGWRLRGEPPGTILEGDWDLSVTSISDSDKFRGVVERYEFGMAWEDTSLFRNRLRMQLDRNGEVHGMRSVQELARYYHKHIDRLYRIIETEGFQPPSFHRRIGPAYTYIGRSGEFMWGPGGNHRLAIAHVLKLEKIPVLVHVRHAIWQNMRESLSTGDISAVSGDLRNHPDLDDVRRRARAHQ